MSTPYSIAKKNLSKAKPKIDITLDGNQNEADVPAYTTLDEIRGQVCITCHADLGFDDIWITVSPGHSHFSVVSLISNILIITSLKGLQRHTSRKSPPRLQLRTEQKVSLTFVD